VVRVPGYLRGDRVLAPNSCDPNNSSRPNRLQTPADIVPEWYFPAVLRDPALGADSCGRVHAVRLDPDPVRAAWLIHLRWPAHGSGRSSTDHLGRLLAVVVPGRPAAPNKPEGHWVLLSRGRHALLLPAFPGDPAAARKLERRCTAGKHQFVRSSQRRTDALRPTATPMEKASARTALSAARAFAAWSGCRTALARGGANTTAAQHWSFDV